MEENEAEPVEKCDEPSERRDLLAGQAYVDANKHLIDIGASKTASKILGDIGASEMTSKILGDIDVSGQMMSEVHRITSEITAQFTSSLGQALGQANANITESASKIVSLPLRQDLGIRLAGVEILGNVKPLIERALRQYYEERERFVSQVQSFAPWYDGTTKAWIWLCAVLHHHYKKPRDHWEELGDEELLAHIEVACIADANVSVVLSRGPADAWGSEVAKSVAEVKKRIEAGTKAVTEIGRSTRHVAAAIKLIRQPLGGLANDDFMREVIEVARRAEKEFTRENCELLGIHIDPDATGIDAIIPYYECAEELGIAGAWEMAPREVVDRLKSKLDGMTNAERMKRKAKTVAKPIRDNVTRDYTMYDAANVSARSLGEGPNEHENDVIKTKNAQLLKAARDLGLCDFAAPRWDAGKRLLEYLTGETGERYSVVERWTVDEALRFFANTSKCHTEADSAIETSFDAASSGDTVIPAPDPPPAYDAASTDWILSSELACLLGIKTRTLNDYRKSATLDDTDEHGRWGVDVVGKFRRNVGRTGAAAYYVPGLSTVYRSKYSHARQGGGGSVGVVWDSQSTPKD